MCESEVSLYRQSERKDKGLKVKNTATVGPTGDEVKYSLVKEQTRYALPFGIEGYFA